MPSTNDWHMHHAISRFLKGAVWKNTNSFPKSQENDSTKDLNEDDSLREDDQKIKYRYNGMMGSFIFIGLVFIFNLAFVGDGARMDPPRAKIIPQEFQVRNFTFVDNYSWLRNYSDDAVKKYISAENDYSSMVLKKFEKLQNEILDEFSKDAYNINASRFWHYGSWMYYILQPANLSHPQYYRYRSNQDCQLNYSSSDELVLDYNQFISQDEFYFMDGIFEVSSDGKLLAFGYDLKGNEEFLLKIWDLESNKEIKIPDIYTYYSLRWVEINNASWVYYNTVDSGVPRMIYRLCVKNCIDDVKTEFIYTELDFSLIVELKLSSDLQYLFIKVEFRFLIPVKWAGFLRIPTCE